MPRTLPDAPLPERKTDRPRNPKAPDEARRKTLRKVGLPADEPKERKRK